MPATHAVAPKEAMATMTKVISRALIVSS
jgi:hypothetical protein